MVLFGRQHFTHGKKMVSVSRASKTHGPRDHLSGHVSKLHGPQDHVPWHLPGPGAGTGAWGMGPGAWGGAFVPRPVAWGLWSELWGLGLARGPRGLLGLLGAGWSGDPPL